MSGLLASFDGAMAGLTPADVDALGSGQDDASDRERPTPEPDDTGHDTAPPRQPAEPCAVQDGDAQGAPRLDPRARELAARLLGHGRGTPAAAEGLATAARPRARVVAAAGDAEVALHAGSGVVIGRADGDLIVPLGVVSRRHCRVEVRGATVTVVDLGSANGTLVERPNGDRVRVAAEPVRVDIGDTLATFRGARPIARIEPAEAVA